MKAKLHIVIILFGMLIIPAPVMAQEQESAEISLEGYSDDFQESFFEALREKAIENYDKAVNLLMKCKNLEPENAVIDYELGKNHTALKQYAQAEGYFKDAIAKDPGNTWYLDALFKLYTLQRNEVKAIALGKQLAEKHPKYKETLVQLYARHQKYEAALQLLDELDKTQGASAWRKEQRRRYQAMRNVKKNPNRTTVKKEEKPVNPLETIQQKIAAYEQASDHSALLTYIDDVLGTYPAQSKFYYIKGKTLNRLKKHTEATAVLTTALDFLVDNTALEHNIYKELVLAYQALGDTGKVREYNKKIKNKA